MLKHIQWDRGGLVDTAGAGQSGLRQNLRIVDADVRRIRICAVLHEQRISQCIIIIPDEMPDAFIVDGFQFGSVAPVRKRVVHVEHVCARGFARVFEKKRLGEERVNEMRKALGEFLDIFDVSDWDNHVGAKQLDDLLRFLCAVH